MNNKSKKNKNTNGNYIYWAFKKKYQNKKYIMIQKKTEKKLTKWVVNEQIENRQRLPSLLNKRGQREILIIELFQYNNIRAKDIK